MHLKIKDHVIVVGDGLNGRNLARVLSETEIPIRRLGPSLWNSKVRREAKDGVPIYYGDATSPSVRHVRIDDVRPRRRDLRPVFCETYRPKSRAASIYTCTLLSRTRYLRELQELHELGADDVVPEEFETSIEIFALVLRT